MHLIEYLGQYPQTVCQKIFTTDQYISRVRRWSDQTILSAVLTNQRNFEGESLVSLLKASDLELKDVGTKQEGYRLTKNSYDNKCAIKPEKSIKIPFLADE